MKTKMLHLLNWHINNITSLLDNIKHQGFTHIMISPVQPTKTDENRWYWLYQPTDFTIGNRLGTKDDYINLCTKAHNIGIKIIVDVVLRHLAGSDDGSLNPHEKCDKYIVSRKDFWLSPIYGDEYIRYDIINKCFGMPSLNYYNLELQSIYRSFLAEILEYSDGIRIDMGKHFALPYEDNCQFWIMIKQLCDEMNKECYAECIFGDKQTILNYTPYTKVLVADYEAPENCDEALIFFESHDTYLTFCNTVSMSDDERIYKYDELLRKFNNVLFYARSFDSLIFSEKIREINKLYV